MIRDDALGLSAAFDGLGWNHTIFFRGNNYEVDLGVSEMTGDQILELFGVLAPGGVPVTGVTVSLSARGLVIS